jgi:hypothetical protein
MWLERKIWMGGCVACEHARVAGETDDGDASAPAGLAARRGDDWDVLQLDLNAGH